MTELTLDVEFLRDLGARCQAAFGEDGSDADASSMHQQIEAVVDAAEAEGLHALAEAALELSVFLCSLVENLSPPGPAAQSRIQAMCDALVSALEPSAATAAAPRTRGKVAPLVVQLVVEPQSQLDLAAELGSRRLRVDRAADLDGLSRVLSKKQADVLVIDAYWLDRCAEVMQTIERCSTTQLHDPGYVAIVARDDRARRMYALRAGVDRVLDVGSPAQIAADIADFVQERKRAAYRVLVVEDDRAQAIFVSSVLGHRGIETAVASNAEEALSMTVEFRPDLFLLDLHLPDRNGIELAQMLRERPGLDLVPIVFLSGEPSMEEHFRAMRLGGDAWISKPVKPRHLLAVVEARAERARRLRARGAATAGSDVRPGMLSRDRLVELLEPRGNAAGLSPRLLLAVAPVEIPGNEQRVNFVAQGRLSDDLARFLGAHRLGKLGVCQPAPFLSLMVVELDPAEAQASLTALQQELSEFGWLSREFPIHLPFAIGAVPLDDDSGNPDDCIARAQQQLASARSGPVRVQLVQAEAAAEPDSWGALRDLFARDQLGAHVQLGFRPLLPIRGRISGQFAVSYNLLVEDTPISAQECQTFARKHGMGVRLDQWLLTHCMQQMVAIGATEELVLGVPIGADSLEDERFAAWLRAELIRHQISAAQLNVWVDAESLRGSPARAQRLLRPFADAGLRVIVGPLSNERFDLDLLQLSELDAVTCEMSSVDAFPSELAKAAVDYGKIVIVQGVDSMALLSDLFNRTVHYALGDAVSAALTAPEFDFPQG